MFVCSVQMISHKDKQSKFQMLTLFGRNIGSLQCWRILASERAHFDKASAILDSNSQETKKGPINAGVRQKEDITGEWEEKEHTPAGTHCLFEKRRSSTRTEPVTLIGGVGLID